MSADEAVHGLKTELERCLKKSREKSQTIAKLQTELKACKNTLDENSTQLEGIQKELSETKVRHLHIVIVALRWCM
jgi:predicted  nucleic acid-binding Zn-ribbon protein